MDRTLNPPIIQLGNRFYRDNSCLYEFVNQESDYNDEEFDDFRGKNQSDEDLTLGLLSMSEPIRQSSNGFECSIGIPKYFHRLIIGKNHSNLSNLQNETSSKIIFPNQNQLSKKVSIFSNNRVNIIRACNQLAAKVCLERKKADPNYFISLPLSDHVKESYSKFIELILKDQESFHLNEDSFTKTSKAHFTICTMFLADDDELQKAKRILSDAISSEGFRDMFKFGPIYLSIKGLSIMNDDLSQVRVLYAKPIQSTDLDRFQIFCNQLRTICSDHGFLAGFNPPNVKLHMTLVNARKIAKLKYKNDLRDKGNEDTIEKMSKQLLNKKLEAYTCLIDAREIFRRFSDYSFAEQFVCKELHFAVRGVEGDKYPYVGQILLPTTNYDIANYPKFVDT